MRMDEWPMTVSSRLGSTQGERLRGSGRRAGGHVGTVFGARIGLFALAVFARFTAPVGDLEGSQNWADEICMALDIAAAGPGG